MSTWLCNEHCQQIRKICIFRHQCMDRRLCRECILSHHNQINEKNILTPEVLVNLLDKKLKDFQEYDNRGFLKIVESLQDKLNVEFQKIENQIKSVKEFIKQDDKPILDMKDQLTKRRLSEFSKEDYNYMRDILEGNILENRLYMREKSKKICWEQLKVLEVKSLNFLDKVEMMTERTICEELEKNVKLKGQVIFGQRQGEFYYTFDDGTTDYAGKYELGMKQGVWNDYLGYDKQKGKRIFDCVKYLNGVHSGKYDWPQCQFDYNFNKIGEWQEVGGQWNQLIQKGQYKRGKKVGLWREYYGESFVGQGQFNQLGQKIGFWKEAIKNYENNPNIFNKSCELTCQGEYINGIKFGEWTLQYKGNSIVCGTYNELGEKIGLWTDLHENFNCDNEVAFTGEYRNGVRYGQWSILYNGNTVICGTYNEKGEKIGQWIDIPDNFKSTHQLSLTGEYRNGIRFGQWAIQYNGINIGGGSYDFKGQKIGQWTYLHDSFHDFLQVIFTGEYRNGFKFGQWTYQERGNNIGGGTYSQKGLKNGQWIDLDDKYFVLRKVTLKGEYKNGIRFGKWTTEYSGKVIGGGSYDQKGVKIGQWTELHEDFNDDSQVILTGQYRDGMRCGQWKENCLYQKIYQYSPLLN